MDMGNEESYQTIFVPGGEMTPYRGCGVGTGHRVNSPLRVIHGRDTKCPGKREPREDKKKGMGGWVLIVWKLEWKEDLYGGRMRLI